MSEQELIVIPLGGTGEIGKNATLLDYGGKMVMVDCGLTFPDVRMFGIDLVIPDFTYLIQNKADFLGIIFTHGHEDHVGALPFLVKDIGPVKIWATPLTLGIIKQKLNEWNIEGQVQCNEIVPRKPFTLGPFTIEGLRVTHSIPDGISIAFRTPAGIFIHSGDFKIDRSPIDQKFTDVTGLATLGSEGVIGLMCDCTNVERAGFTGSEKSVKAQLEEIFQASKSRVFITTFASNIHRVQQAMEVALHTGRKVFLVGRSMVANVKMALNLGYLKIDTRVLAEDDELEKLPNDQVCIICTGSQGEPMSALRLISSDDHRVAVKNGDVVIFSASPIPGNETEIYSMVNSLYQQGAEVIYGTERGVHVSGHGSQEDIKMYLSLVKPNIVIPTHGQYRHQKRFVNVAGEMDISEKNVVVAGLGDRIALSKLGARFIGKIRAGPAFVDGRSVGYHHAAMLEERRELAEEGVLVISIGLDWDGNKVLSGPEVVTRGFTTGKDFEGFLEDVKNKAVESLFKNRDRSGPAVEQLRKNMKIQVEKFVSSRLRISPIIVPLVTHYRLPQQEE